MQEIVLGENNERFIGAHGYAQLIPKPCSNGCFHLVDPAILTVTRKAMLKTDKLPHYTYIYMISIYTNKPYNPVFCCNTSP